MYLGSQYRYVYPFLGEVRLELIEKGMLEKCRQVQLAFPKTDSAHKAAGATIEALLGQEGVGNFIYLL